MNPFHENDRLTVMEHCCYQAVQTVFQHLSLEEIQNPPRSYFDAKLARQIAIRIMTVEFDAARRRLAIRSERRRASIAAAVRTIDQRLEDGRFRTAYQRMVKHAVMLYDHRMEMAA